MADSLRMRIGQHSDKGSKEINQDFRGACVPVGLPLVHKDDDACLDRFLFEEWVARRIHSPHVLRAVADPHQREYFFVALEPVQGQTLAQWMIDHPRSQLAKVHDTVAQFARGLQAAGCATDPAYADKLSRVINTTLRLQRVVT